MREETAAAYVRVFASLSRERLPELAQLCAVDMRFRDPFTDVRGRDRFIRVFEGMFRGLEGPRFDIVDHALSGDRLYIRWDFHFARSGRPWTIEGMSEVHFNAEGLVSAHLDHWDSGAQFYAKLPLIGFLVRLVAHRVGRH